MLQRAFFLLLLITFCPAAPASAAIVSDQVLKTFFQTGDKPTEGIPPQEEFADLIDSYLAVGMTYGSGPEDHSLRLVDGRIALDGLGQVLVLREGEMVNDTLAFSEVNASVNVNPLAGELTRYIGVQFDINQATHFGFLQLQVEGPGSSDPYAIHLQHFVYEDTPDVGLTTFYQAIPEPATVLLLLGGMLCLGRHRRQHLRP